MELHLKYRPKRLKDIVGQPEAVKVLSGMVAKGKIPQCMMFCGPSGCGKTTAARIMKDALNCSDVDFAEVNAANYRGIEMARNIQETISLAPWKGKKRVWIIDEAQRLTGEAQDCLLKVLEEPPKHAHLFLCTTEPGKLRPAVKTRTTEVKFRTVTEDELADLLKTICTKEGVKLTQDVLERTAEASEGSPRKALKILEQVINLKTEEEQLDAIQKSEHRRYAFEIYGLLLRPGTKWQDIAAVVRDLEEEPETVRRIIMACAATSATGGKNGNAWGNVGKALAIIDAFRDPVWDSKALLVLSLAEAHRAVSSSGKRR